MSEHAGHRRWRLLALIWALLVLALAWQQLNFWRAPALDTDVMALLPGEQQDPLLAVASQRIADSATRQVVVLVGSAEWASTRLAAQRFGAVIAAADDALRLQRIDSQALDQAIDYYRNHRGALLTASQRRDLGQAELAPLLQQALARLYAPGPAAGLLSWREDPLDLWSSWWQARSGALAMRDGLVALAADDQHWAVLRYSYQQSAFRFDGSQRLGDLLAEAESAARAAADEAPISVLHGGVPLHAEAAAARANWEVNTIGLGSLAAVVLLVWTAFRRIRPLLLVALSLGIGVAAGAAVTALVFGQVHLLTLVFGASLVGVAEDYGIHYYASRQQSPQVPALTMMRRLLAGLALALVTSALAYLALGLAPFPGLRQMAVFSATGLAAAFLTVVLWFPWLDRSAPRASGFSTRIAGSLQHWPRIAGARGWVLIALLLIFIGGGLAKLQVSDSLRSLQSSPPALLAKEAQIVRVLGLPSPAQFYLVQGEDAQQLLKREEVLGQALQPLLAAGELKGYRAVSQWLPSIARQRADSALSQPLEEAVRERAGALLGEDLVAAGPTPAPLQPSDWLALAIAEPLRPLWLGEVDNEHGSVVMLEGLTSDSDLDALAAIAQRVDGVRWVNRTQEIGLLLGHYRQMMSGLLLLGYLAVALALQLRFGRGAWRALLPTALAALLSVALLGWLGVPFQLFSVLAQLLLLGIGVDYGIFLFEHRQDPASWLAINVGAASTLLAFGLLSLSATPALHSFGLSLLFGIALVWLLSPCFRPLAASESAN